MSVLDEIRNDANGLALLYDWLGDEERPMRQHTADVRAAICLDCNKHRPGKWWEQMVKDPIAEVIRKQLQIKHQMKLETTFDDVLGMCRVCGCCIRTKVWVPPKHLKNHTPLDRLKQYPPWCWVPPEIESIS